MALEAGSRLGPYEILSPIGAGGMGEVYRAKDTKLHREVAIKVLPADVASSPERLQRFEREATTVAALNHPNIVTIFGIEESDGHRFIAMELVEGETLDRMIAPGGMSLAKIFDIAIPLSDALAAAHDKGIVHRDLKPANVMVTKEGRVKVLDFGLAKLTAAGQGGSSPDDVTMSAPLTGRGVVMGTVPYMSPEQLNGEDLDHRTDLFSLGIMLYELATGQRPFKGKTSASIMSSILRDTPRPVQELNSILPRHLGRIIEHCLEKDPEQRFQSAKDIRNELRALRKEVDSGSDYSEAVSTPPTPAPPPSSTSSTPSSGSAMSAPARRGELWIGVGVIAVVIVLAAVWLGRGGSVSEETAAINAPSRTTPSTPAKPSVTQDTQKLTDLRTTLAILPFENVSSDPDTDYLSNEIPASIIDKLSGLSGLRVISRNGAFRFDPAKEDASSFGKSLGASVVLTGQLNARGSNLTIRAELVDVTTNQQLWSKRYPRELTDIMAVEADITQSISQALRLKLTPEERTVLAKDYTKNAEAYRSLLQGRYWFQKFTVAGWRRALGHLQDAVRIDPAYALAHAELSKVYSGLGMWFGDMPPDEAGTKAKQAAATAIALDDTLGEAHGALGFNRFFYDWDWSGAEEEFLRSISLAPESGEVHLHYGILLRVTGRLREAEEVIKVAQQLDPTFPMSFAELGETYTYMGRYEEGIEQCEKALDLDPQFPPAYEMLGNLFLAKGMYDEAISHFEKNSSLRNRQTDDLGYLGSAYALAGERAKALAILNELRSIASKGRGQVAAAKVHACLGNVDAAFASLEQAYRQRGTGLLWLKSELQFDPLRGDPRFDELLRRIGFEPIAKSQTETRPLSEKTRLAILPFKDNSPKPEEWLASGLADSISTQLGRVNPSKLGVLGPETTTYYAQAGNPIRDLSADLNVAFVLRGSIQVIGNDVRIMARLIRADDLTSVWSDEFKGTMDDPFGLQSMVAEKIIAGLPFELTGEERVRLRNRYTANPKAELAYMQGRFFGSSEASVEKNLLRAVSYFEQAIEIDPEYALPYCGLVDAKCVLAIWGTLQTSQIRSEMEDTVARVLALDDTLAEAHVSAGFVATFLNWDWPAAETAFERAIRLDPNLSRAHLEYGHMLVLVGRYDEAKERFEEAIRLNPVSSSHLSRLGMLYAGLGKLSEAEPFLQKAYELNKDNPDASFWLADVRQKQGRFNDAAEIMERSVFSTEHPELARLGLLGNAYAMAGRMDDARKQLAQMHKMKGEVPGHHMWFAEIHAALGEKDEAFRRLDQALAAREAWLPHLRFDPGLIHIRSDPRFAELHRKMGLGHVDLSVPAATP